MLFSRSVYLALVSAPFLAFAQEPLSFTIEGSFEITAGEPVEITWTGGEASDSVTLVLRSGDAANLDAGTVIAENIPNTGVYEYTAPETITAGSDYALQIINAADPADNNYSGQFNLESENTVPSDTPIVTLAAPTGSSLPISAPSLAPTQSPSAFPTTIPTTTGEDTTATSATTESETSATATSGTTTMSETSATATTAAPTMETVAEDNGAARATAVGAMLGAVALAALAL